MARELSSKWWNVIRRKVRATPATEHEVQCPDCGSETFLSKGRYGRFYRCGNVWCSGTVGAKLDGTPRKPRGSQELLQAQEQARAAVHLVLLERKLLGEMPKLPSTTPDQDWYNFRVPSFQLDIERIVTDAKVGCVNGVGYYFGCPVLFLRKRSIEECQRVREAALKLYFKLVEERDNRTRRLRNNAWDQIYLGILEDVD